MNSALPKSRLGRGLASLIGEPSSNGGRLPPEGEQRMVAIAQVLAQPHLPGDLPLDGSVAVNLVRGVRSLSLIHI